MQDIPQRRNLQKKSVAIFSYLQQSVAISTMLYESLGIYGCLQRSLEISSFLSFCSILQQSVAIFRNICRNLYRYIVICSYLQPSLKICHNLLLFAISFSFEHSLNLLPIYVNQCCRTAQLQKRRVTTHYALTLLIPN